MRYIYWTFILLFSLASEVSSETKSQRKQRNHRHLLSNMIAKSAVSTTEQLALLHSQRVSEAGSCDKPILQVIHVTDHYPGRYFLPHCTLLHRCGKHSGCCGTNQLKCVAAVKEKVSLNFYSVRIPDDGTLPEYKIETLTFTNHTRCGCVLSGMLKKSDL